MSIWPLKKGIYSRKPVHVTSWQPMEMHSSEPLAAMRRMQHLYVRTAACPIPRPLLVHYPRKTLGHLEKDQELGHVKDVCPRHCSITGGLPPCSS